MELDEQLINTLLQAMPIGDIPTDDEADMARRTEILATIASPELEVSFVASGGAFHGDFHGLEGYRDGWRDWLQAFGRCRIELEEVREWPDGLVVLTRQTLTPKGTDASMESDAAAVLTFENDKLQRIEFHLDRDSALRAAGLDA